MDSLTPAPMLTQWRQLTNEERAAIAAYFAREGYPGLMFVPTEAGDVVLVVMEPVKKVENTEAAQ